MKTELQKTLWATESGLSSVKIRCKWTFAQAVQWYSLPYVFTVQSGAYFLKGLKSLVDASRSLCAAVSVS